MELLDLSTLLRINLAFNLLAALVWLLLGEVFRMAPRASRLMVATHLVRLLPQSGAAIGPPWQAFPSAAVAQLAWLASTALLLLALRRMLRCPNSPRDVAWITGIGALGMLAAMLLGPPELPVLIGGVAVIWLSLRTVHDLLAGAGRALSPLQLAIIALPFLGVAALTTARVVALALAEGLGGEPAGLPPLFQAAATLVLTFSLTLTLMALLIWRLISRIQHLMLSDPLTGASSRRGFEQTLADAHARLLRGHPYAVVMADIDHFKQLNDRHGHAAGDAALQHCVRLWQATLREHDRVGRLGGEEFAMLLPDADLRGATAAAERMRRKLEAEPLLWGGQPLALTASFGVALPSRQETEPGPALQRADAELYIAKTAGRNRVSAARPERQP